MSDWVRNDLGGKGATGRTMIPLIIPAIVVLAPREFGAHGQLIACGAVALNQGIEMQSRQRTMAGHGILMIFSTPIAGLVLSAKPLGGWEVRPCKIVKVNVPGTDEGWATRKRR